MALKLITAAPAAIVSVAECKRYIGIASASTDWDTLIEDLIASAAAEIEERVGRALGEQTLELSLAVFDDLIVLPRGPVTGVASVKYDAPGAPEQTLSVDAYSLDLVGDPQLIVLNDGAAWPALATTPNPVRVRFTAGYGAWDDGESVYTGVPAPLKLAHQMIVAARFEDRAAAVPDAVDGLIEPYRAGWFAA